MKNSLKTAARLALALSLCAFSGLTAEAQVVRQTSLTGPMLSVAPASTCLTVGASSTLVFDPQTSGATWASWKIEGDYTIVSNTATSLVFTATDYGKIRVTVGYYITTGTATCGTCTYNVRTYDSKVYEFYKTFTTWPATLDAQPTPMAIGGPQCVSAGSSVVYSIPPVVSRPGQIAKNIGIDTYSWKVVLPDNTLVPYTYAAGDYSAISFTAPNQNYKLRLVVGKCNAIGGIPQSNYANVVSGAEKVLPVTTSPSVAAISSFPSCVRNNQSSFNFALSNLTVGAVYGIQTSLGNISIALPTVFAGGSFTATATTQMVTVNQLTGLAGDVFVTTAGGCASQAVVRSLTRTLTSDFNAITGTPKLSDPLCLDGTATLFPLTLSNGPGGAAGYTWTLPAGTWLASGTGVQQTLGSNIATSTLPTINITPPAGHTGGTVRVEVTGCPTPVQVPSIFVERVIKVSGFPAGCDASKYEIKRSASNGFGLNPIASAPTCPLPFAPVGTYYYRWEWLNSGMTPAPFKDTEGPSVSFGFPILPTGTATIRVTINDPTSCFVGAITNFLLRPAPGGSGGSGGSNPAAMRLQDALKVYPNPAGNTLQVELPADARASLTLFDALGRAVRQQTAVAGRAALNVKDLPQGQYNLRVETPGGTTNRQVQVQH